jgi:aldose sugar dehydrogenase
MNTSLLAALVLGASLSAPGAHAAPPSLKPVTVVSGLDNPWSLAFLPDGRMLVTEKPGRLRVVSPQGKLGPPVSGLPKVDAAGQCGLLDVVPDPDFAKTGLVFWTFAEPGEGGNSTAVARGKLEGDRLVDVRTIFSQKPKVSSRAHCGSRIVFGRDGTLWVGLGDRFSRKDDAQDPANHLGKVIRIDRDGGVPADNPKLAAPEVWSLGHRNIQGAARHPGTGALWTVEHGPQGGDEVNVPKAGANHGWPLVTRGRNYVTGTRIGEDGPKAGFEEPLKMWAPSIAPSGMAFLTSDRYPGWKGSLFIGALKAEALVRLPLEGQKVAGEERLLENLGERFRDVRQGPDGWLYVVTDGSDGKVLRLER